MNSISDEEKRRMKSEWAASQRPQYILEREQVEDLFAFLDHVLDETPCDHTLRHTAKWIGKNCPDDKKEAVFREIQEMGGYCDCEVLMNCYEEYEID